VIPRPKFHWFLPTGGDDERLGANSHGVSIGTVHDPAGDAAGGRRDASLEYLTELARTVDELGFDAVLTPTGGHCEDAWLVTSALIPATRRLKFLVAFRPGAVAPVLAAQMVSTFDRLSGGRILLNIVVGGDDAEQRAFGDTLNKEERYARADQFLEIAHAVGHGEPVQVDGPFYTVDRPRSPGFAGHPSVPLPDVYLGGSSDAALDVAARRADVFLTWGEPPEAVGEKLARVSERAAAAGRTIRGGVRLHVIARDSADEAWRAAENLIADVDADTIDARQRQLAAIGSEGQRRMLALHGGNRDNLVIGPNLWAGIGLTRGGAGTALVGSHDEIADRIDEYRDAGVEEFIFSGYPHLEEARHFGTGVLPKYGSGERDQRRA
jgi:alkanesulfonate monooxygenase